MRLSFIERSPSSPTKRYIHRLEGETKDVKKALVRLLIQYREWEGNIRGLIPSVVHVTAAARKSIRELIAGKSTTLPHPVGKEGRKEK